MQAPTVIKKSFQGLQSSLKQLTERSINIIGVTKRHPPGIYEICEEMGLTSIAENRVQELRNKKQSLENRNLKVHFIGPMQTNKVKYIIDVIDSIDSLSSNSLVEMIEKKRDESKKPIEVLIQINSTEEAQKSGLLISQFKSIYDLALRCVESKSLELKGLMTMGPTPSGSFSASSEDYKDLTRAAFEKTRILNERLELELGMNFSRLSMGMSHDFEIAIEEGATEIRVGSLLFGERPVAERPVAERSE